MCNLYSLQTTHEAMIQMFRIEDGNVESWSGSGGIYPDQLAPVVHRNDDGRRALTQMRWGFPPPPAGMRPVTNVRNLGSGFWRRYLDAPEQRCLVPVTSFSEWSHSKPKTLHWFSLAEKHKPRPLCAFAGIWRDWQGVRKGDDGTHRLMAFLTTDANEIVKPIHPKAMPVLIAPDDYETWLRAPWQEAIELTQSVLSNQLNVVNVGTKTDEVTPSTNSSAP